MSSNYEFQKLLGNNIFLEDEVVADIGGPQFWTALKSSLDINKSYELDCTVEPCEYIDIQQRYKVISNQSDTNQLAICY